MRRALLLAAGAATRLGPLRERYAKACVPVAGTTPLGFLLPRLAAAGVGSVIVNLHHRGAQVRDEAERAAPEGLALEFMEEPVLLGTGGTLLQATRLLNGLPDLVVNAKVFGDLDFAGVLAAPAPAVLLHPDSDLAVFGGFRHEGGRVLGLRLRGSPSQEAGCAVFTGVCRPDPAWIAPLQEAVRVRPGQAICLVRDALLPAIGAGHPVAALLHTGWWNEISTPERVRDAAEQVALRVQLN